MASKGTAGRPAIIVCRCSFRIGESVIENYFGGMNIVGKIIFSLAFAYLGLGAVYTFLLVIGAIISLLTFRFRKQLRTRYIGDLFTPEPTGIRRITGWIWRTCVEPGMRFWEMVSEPHSSIGQMEELPFPNLAKDPSEMTWEEFSAEYPDADASVHEAMVEEAKVRLSKASRGTPISRSTALNIARRAAEKNGMTVDDLTSVEEVEAKGFATPFLFNSRVPIESCWIAYLDRNDGFSGIRESYIMLISKATGEIEYEGGASDEG